jgi:hypothetical protein
MPTLLNIFCIIRIYIPLPTSPYPPPLRPPPQGPTTSPPPLPAALPTATATASPGSSSRPSYPATPPGNITYPAKKVEKPKPPPMSSSYVSRVLGPRTEGVAPGSCPPGPAPDLAQAHRITTQLPGKQLPGKQLPGKQLPGKQLPGKRSKTETGPGGPRGRW